jgi:hypothetical protein
MQQHQGRALMQYVRLYTTIYSDPKAQRLSDKAFRYYINALAWSGHHDRNGEYEVAGKVPRFFPELVEGGFFEPTGTEGVFLIHGWDKRQASYVTREARSEAGKKGADARWHGKSHDTESSVGMANRNAREEKKRVDQTEATPSPEKPARARDALFDALATATDRDPTGMTRREQRACGTALADIRRATPTLTPAELQRRAAHYRAHFPQAALTPSALANQWSACDRPPMSAAKETRAERLAKEIVG